MEDRFFPVGCCIQTHPATDAWMKGDRYGEVIGHNSMYVSVKMDKSGKKLKFHPANISHSNKEAV